MTAKAETKITEDILAWIKDNGGDAFHVHGSMYQRSGEPDICGEINQTFLGLYKSMPLPDKWIHLKWEVKTKTGKPSKLQIVRLDRYVKRGYCSGIVTSVAEGIDLLYEFLKYGNNLKSWEESGYAKQIAAMARD